MLPVLFGAILALTPVDGHAVYLQQCASCHGVDLRGGVNAPDIRGVGAADVDFWVSTGRMPAAVPWIEVGHRGAMLPQATIDALVAYVTSVQPGGPAIPIVTTGGDAARGATLFRENCMHCHGASAEGAAIGDQQWAPALDRATVTQVAEAIRIGPGEMPSFGTAQLSPDDVDDIATYLSDQRAAGGFRGLPASSSGPVPEGLLGWLAAGALAVLAFAFSPPRKDPAP
jgi:ubiquinol-cytochrome c reductase cytochrome c subunit